MAFKRKAYKGIVEDTNEYFVCDNVSDISNLPTDAEQGSMAFVIEDSSFWMIDSSGVWKSITAPPGGFGLFFAFGSHDGG